MQGGRGSDDSLADKAAGLGVADQHARDAIHRGASARLLVVLLMHARMHLEQRLLRTGRCLPSKWYF